MVASGTTRNVVEGRQPNDRREAGGPVADDRDRTCRTRVASTFSEVAVGYLPVCNQILRNGINHSAVAMLRSSTVGRALAVQVCGPDIAARRGLVAIGCSSSKRRAFGCSRGRRLRFSAISNCVGAACGC